MTALAVMVALLSAALFAVGSVLQQRAATDVPDEDALGLGLVTRLVRRPIWLAGTAGDTLGYVAQAIALALGSLVLVQPLLATSLLFALPLGAWWAGRRLRRSDGVWALVLTAALGVFLVSGNPTEGVDRASVEDWLVAAAILGPLTAACIIVAVRTRGSVRAVALASASGILYGVAAALTKSTMSLLDDGPVEHRHQLGALGPGRRGRARHVPAAVLLPGRLAGPGPAGRRRAGARGRRGARHRDTERDAAGRRPGVGADRGRGRGDDRGDRGAGAFPGRGRRERGGRARTRGGGGVIHHHVLHWYDTTIVEGGRSGAFWLLISLLTTFLIVRGITRRIRARRPGDADAPPGGVLRDVTVGGVHIHHQVYGIGLVLISAFLEFRFQPGSPWVEVLAHRVRRGRGPDARRVRPRPST